MDSFNGILDGVTNLNTLCVENIGNEEIGEISADIPVYPLDELFFRKAIAWLYLLLNETGPFFRFSARLLRSDPRSNEKLGKFKNIVECARTTHAHNISQQNKGGEGKKRQYDIWLIENGGDPVDWQKCCRILITDSELFLEAIRSTYAKLCENQIDREQLWREYTDEKRVYWEAHEFDTFVEKSSINLNIKGLDCTLFRKEGNRLERWRNYVAMFDTRAEAEKAIERVIYSEMHRIFGDNFVD